jgi:hypothetical protein
MLIAQSAWRFFQILPNHSFLKTNPLPFNTFRSFGIELGPIPCNFNNCVVVNSESFTRLLIPAFSSARLAGADTTERNSSSGFFMLSQMGQTGQSLLL